MGDHREESKVIVLAVPLPFQSHLNQLLQLACLIATYDLEVHYATSETHVHQAKLRFNHKKHPAYKKILFHKLSTPPSLSPPPLPSSSDKFPSHLLPSFQACDNLRQPVAELLCQLSGTARRVVVVHDVHVTYVVQDVANIPNAESYAFNPICAFSSLFDVCQLLGKQIPCKEPEGLPSVEGCCPLEILKFFEMQTEFMGIASGNVFNSCRSIEETYIDMHKLAMSVDKNIWAIGPLHLQIEEDKSSSHKCLEWLDKQDPNTVFYISFGTTTTMTKEEIREIAIGLEQSKQKFIWVLREADRGNIFEGKERRDLLPEGFEERVKGFGIVERDWVPQAEILGHSSIGGFMSHCGWNSCLESIAMGVPIAAWPMHSDQPKNAFFVTKILKVGLMVSLWEDREKLVTSETIAQVIEKIMTSKEGEEMRKRAKDLSLATQKAVIEGGVSKMELNSFISHISR